jgi:hypothetical protein
MNAISYPPDNRRKRKLWILRLFKVCQRIHLANELGSAAVLLIHHIASAEDGLDFLRPPRHWNSELMKACGLRDDEAFAKVRDKAVAAGWLHYGKGGIREAGTYWVTIPDSVQELLDGDSKEPRSCSGKTGSSPDHKNNHAPVSPVHDRSMTGPSPDHGKHHAPVSPEDRRSMTGPSPEHDRVLSPPSPSPNPSPMMTGMHPSHVPGDFLDPDPQTAPPPSTVVDQRTFGDFQATHPRIFVGPGERDTWESVLATWGWDPLDESVQTIQRKLAAKTHRVLLSQVTRYLDENFTREAS